MTVREWFSNKWNIVRLYWNAGAQARKRWDDKRHERSNWDNGKH